MLSVLSLGGFSRDFLKHAIPLFESKITHVFCREKREISVEVFKLSRQILPRLKTKGNRALNVVCPIFGWGGGGGGIKTDEGRVCGCT